jgi:competence protein ComEA
MKGKIRLLSYAIMVALTFMLGTSSFAAQAEVDAKAKKEKKAYKDDKADAKADKAKPSETRGHSKKIDLNTASRDELLTLKGVGPATADAIIAARPFSKVEELKDVPGIGDVRWGEIRREVTVKESKAKVKKERKEPRATKTAPAPSERAPAGAPATTEQSSRSERPRLEQPKGRPAPPAPADDELSEIRQVNINTASREELESLLGIGPVKAQAIIDNRPYRSIEEVMEVKGIKKKTFEQMRGRIVVR